MSSRQISIALGLAAAGAGGYYLYSAGGNPQVAKKQIEYDASRASAKVKSELPGSGKQIEKKGEEWATRAGAKIDSTIDDARAKLDRAGKDADQYRKDAAKDLQNKIDKVDKKVEEGAAKAKSGVSGWFGGK
ncbi:MAG: hypothetical protein M1829_004379 [Trizodia sp. TS-e1964]|nr:MAG: hypothetical protein M1829_004379 [Trizodia sp. TS-e1964]